MSESALRARRRTKITQWVIRAAVRSSSYRLAWKSLPLVPEKNGFEIFQKIGLVNWIRSLTEAMEIAGGYCC
jgi:hypothetical protein